MTKITKLHNIESSFSGYEQIANLYYQHKNDFTDSIPIEIQQWFSANMAAPLGAVLDLLNNNLNTIVFNHIDNEIKSVLQKNGFLSYFGYSNQYDTFSTTIQYKKMKPYEGRYFREYVSTQFLNRSELPNISKGLRGKIVEAMSELFANAQIHSETKQIYTCGQFFPKRNTIEFCIVDTGIGFKQKFIRRFKKNVSSIQAINWSILDKHTTKTDMSGGIGLAILKEFIILNQGKLQIVSYDGFYQYDSNGEQTRILSNDFPGTIVNVLFHTNDTKNYLLLGDIDKRNKMDFF